MTAASDLDPAQLLAVRGNPTSEELVAVVVALLLATAGADRVDQPIADSTRSWASIGTTAAATWHGPAAWSVAPEPWRAVG